MNTILFILTWAGNQIIFPPLDVQKACEESILHPGSKVEAVLKDYSKKKITCEKIPEKKITTTIAAYWTAY